MDLPEPLVAYLTINDSILQAQLRSQHPELDELAADPAVQRRVLDWLAQPEALTADNTLVANALAFVRPVVTPDHAELVRPLTLDDDERVRQAAYELLLSAYFPDVNRPALLLVLQAMLNDESPQIRMMGAAYVDRAGAAQELATYLRRWAARQPANETATQLVLRALGEDVGGGS